MEIPIKVVIHKVRYACVYGSEVPAPPGCTSEGEAVGEIEGNIRPLGEGGYPAD